MPVTVDENGVATQETTSQGAQPSDNADLRQAVLDSGGTLDDKTLEAIDKAVLIANTSRDETLQDEANELAQFVEAQSIEGYAYGERKVRSTNVEYNPRQDLENRVPFTITTAQRFEHYGIGPNNLRNPGAVWSHGGWRPCKKIIELTINPSQMTIAQGLRAGESKNLAGTVQYTWPDKLRQTFFDEPKVTFHFQAGNIHPLSYLQDAKRAAEVPTGKKWEPSEAVTHNQPIPSGLADLYEFLGMLDEDRITIKGLPNYVILTANSRKFPKIQFIGFFDPEGVTIEETSEDQNSATWQATMTCRYTAPRLFSAAELRTMFLQNPVSPPRSL